MRLGQSLARGSGKGNFLCCKKEPEKVGSLSLPDIDLSCHQCLFPQLWDDVGPAWQRSYVLSYITKLLSRPQTYKALDICSELMHAVKST